MGVCTLKVAKFVLAPERKAAALLGVDSVPGRHLKFNQHAAIQCRAGLHGEAQRNATLSVIQRAVYFIQSLL